MIKPVVLALCAVIGAIWPAAAGTVIKLGSLSPVGSALHVVLTKMQRDWDRISDGAVTLQIHAGGVAGDESDMLRKMRVGELHAATLTSGG